MASFPDHFSTLAGGYARHRPGYPDALFTWLAAQAPARERAWDCATGSGQAAVGLAAHFAAVAATDASAAQIEAATAHPRVRYGVAPAEASGLAGGSVSLVTAAQALHWFDLPRFHAEARRVLVPGGVIAVWSYNLLTVTPAVDAVVNRLYGEALAGYWPAERHHVESGYRTLPFPFEPVEPPPFAMTARWSLADLTGYLRTWSAVDRCRGATGRDPVAAVERALAAAWGPAERTYEVRWPLALRVGRN